MRYCNVAFIVLLFFGVVLSSTVVFAFDSYVSNPSPGDGAVEIDYSEVVRTCVYVNIPDGCQANITFYWNDMGQWSQYESYVNASAKGTFCGNLSVECGSTYFWRVTAFIDCGGGMFFWENHTYSFSTVDCPVSHVEPVNGSVSDCPCCLALCARLTNLSGDTVKFAFQSNYSGSWENLEPVRVVPANESYCLCVPEFVWFNYTYYWRVMYSNGSGLQYSDVFHFTTAECVEECPCGEGSGLVYVEEKWLFAAMVSVSLSLFFVMILYVNRKTLNNKK